MLVNKIIKYLIPVCFVLFFIMIGYNTSNSASKFTAIRNLDIETLIERDQAGSSYFRQSVEDGFGNVLEVFSKSDGNLSQIWAKRYNKSTESWSNPVKIGACNTVNIDLNLVTDASGNGLVIWSQNNENHCHLWANRFIATENRWSGAESIETNITSEAYDPHLITGESGNFFVVWKENKSGFARYWTNHFHADTGHWAKAALVSDQNVAP